MSVDTLAFKVDPSAAPRTTETFTDGPDRIASTRLSEADFLANEDERMAAFVALYKQYARDDALPTIDEITPELIFTTGMMSRTHCLRRAETPETFRYAVWAQDANFDGYRSLQNMSIDKSAPFPILTQTVQSQLSAAINLREPVFFEVRGLINDHYYYFTKAILPLRNKEGEITKCFVPFTDKLPDIPPDLRDEFCMGALE